MYFVKYRDNKGLSWIETSTNYKDIRDFVKVVESKGWTVVSSQLS